VVEEEPMTDELSNDREIPAQMQNALDWLKRESGRGYNVERGLASLEKTVGTSAIGPGAASPFARSPFGWKAGGMIGVCALLGIAAYATVSNVPSERRVGSTGPVPASASPAPSMADSPALTAPSIVASEVTVESLPISVLPSSTTGSRSPRNVGATPSVRPVRRKPAPPSEDPAHAELAHAARLRALEAVDPSAALREAAEGDRLFARGVLGEEREAIAIGALAKLGRTQEVRERAARYLAAHPTGPLAEEVRQLAGPGSSSSPGELP
jgi:hypothetical protein